MYGDACVCIALCVQLMVLRQRTPHGLIGSQRSSLVRASPIPHPHLPGHFAHITMPAKITPSRPKKDMKPYAKPEIEPISRKSPDTVPETPRKIPSAKKELSHISDSFDIDTKPQAPVNSNKAVSPKARQGGKAWTMEEKLQLFRFAMDRHGRGWEEAVSGRSASQSSQTWK